MFSDEKISFRGFLRRHQIGIYATIMFHLLVLAVLMLTKIDALINEPVVVIDFSNTEIAHIEEQIDRLEQLKKTAQDEVNALLAGSNSRQSQQELRNIALDASPSGALRDDRNTNAKDLYDEAQRVQDRLDAARNAQGGQSGQGERMQNEQVVQGDEPGMLQQPSSGKKAEAYKGPSVMSYNLGGRKAVRLPVPVYQCDGGGDVTVTIEVNRQGRVTGATIQTNVSANNTCLHEAAIRAALLSRFSVDSGASDPQKGNIVYRFIAQ